MFSCGGKLNRSVSYAEGGEKLGVLNIVIALIGINKEFGLPS